MNADESTENKRKKLIFRSWHTGTREADLILGSFADKYLADFTDEELDLYDDLLKIADSDICSWINSRKNMQRDKFGKIIAKLQEHGYRTKRSER